MTPIALNYLEGAVSSRLTRNVLLRLHWYTQDDFRRLAVALGAHL